MSAPRISFEFFPTKTEEGERTLLEKTIPALRQLKPDFCSVTYGAGGGTREKTLMIVDRIQREQGLTKLWCEVLESNEAVWKLHERHGFVREARFRRHIVKDGVGVDVLGLGLLAEDWAGRRAEMAARLAEKGFVVP